MFELERKKRGVEFQTKIENILLVGLNEENSFVRGRKNQRAEGEIRKHLTTYAYTPEKY